MEQPITNDSYVQVPDEISLVTFSDSSRCKSSSMSSILSTNEIFVNMDLCGANSQTCRTWPELSNNLNRLLKQDDHIDSRNLYGTRTECPIKIIKDINKDQKIYHDNPHLSAKTMLAMKEEDKCDSEFKLIHDVMRETSCMCSQNNAQQQVGCVDLNIFQNLKMKLYAQERKKRHLQRYIKQQRQYIEKLLQRKSFSFYDKIILYIFKINVYVKNMLLYLL